MEKNIKKRRGRGHIVATIIIIALVAVAAFSLYKILSQILSDAAGQDVYTNLADAAISQETVSDSAGGDASAADANAEGGADDDADDADDDAADRNGEGSSGRSQQQLAHGSIDFNYLLSINENCVGWLELPGTIIDYPIVHGTDNSYYLDHLIDGSYHRYGTLFIDTDNTADFSDDNTVIYGHNMNSGAMFGELDNYDDQDFYEENPILYLYTPNGNYILRVFASCYVDGADGLPLQFADADTYSQYLQSLYDVSTISTGVQMTTDDKMVMLYTCAYSYETERHVVCTKLEPLS